MTVNSIRGIFCLAATFITIGAKAEANIIYTLNPILGYDGSTLTGAITTDGATGLLSSTDILGASFESPGDLPVNTTFYDSSPNNVIATETGLRFSGITSSLLFYYPSATYYYVFLNANQPASWNSFFQVEETYPPTTGPMSFTSQGYFATASAAVPEPTTIVLFGAGILGLVGIRFVCRRTRKSARDRRCTIATGVRSEQQSSNELK